MASNIQATCFLPHHASSYALLLRIGNIFPNCILKADSRRYILQKFAHFSVVESSNERTWSQIGRSGLQVDFCQYQTEHGNCRTRNNQPRVEKLWGRGCKFTKPSYPNDLCIIAEFLIVASEVPRRRVRENRAGIAETYGKLSKDVCLVRALFE